MPVSIVGSLFPCEGGHGLEPEGYLRYTRRTTAGHDCTNASRPVTGIGGIFFKAKDPKALCRWYRHHLGLDIEDTMALFSWRGGRDGKVKGHTVWSIFPSATNCFGEDGAPFMITYRVKDLDGLIAALRREGVDIDSKGRGLRVRPFRVDHGSGGKPNRALGAAEVNRAPEKARPMESVLWAVG